MRKYDSHIFVVRLSWRQDQLWQGWAQAAVTQMTSLPADDVIDSALQYMLKAKVAGVSATPRASSRSSHSDPISSPVWQGHSFWEIYAAQNLSFWWESIRTERRWRLYLKQTRALCLTNETFRLVVTWIQIIGLVECKTEEITVENEVYTNMKNGFIGYYLSNKSTSVCTYR